MPEMIIICCNKSLKINFFSMTNVKFSFLYKLIIVYYNKQNFLSEIILINAASETSNAHVFL